MTEFVDSGALDYIHRTFSSCFCKTQNLEDGPCPVADVEALVASLTTERDRLRRGLENILRDSPEVSIGPDGDCSYCRSHEIARNALSVTEGSAASDEQTRRRRAQGEQTKEASA